MVKIFRVYNNGDIKNETHVLQLHFSDGQQRKGYDGDVRAWSEQNKKIRFGCAQIVKHDGKSAEAIYSGYLGQSQLDAAIAEINLSRQEPKDAT